MKRALAAALSFFARAAQADQAGECHTVDIDLVPTSGLQIVAWIEDTHGNYVDTAYITQTTGTYGLGNRPGRFDFNSGPSWPYGRRITTFPVWSHAHGMVFPEVDFQDGADDNLSHEMAQSSHEPHFCRPLAPSEAAFDTGTCPTIKVDTDKGTLSTTRMNLYPPRVDVGAHEPSVDSTDIDMYPSLNPFDTVSAATPEGDMPATLVWTMPASIPDGDYVLFVEVSKEFDQNASYDTTKYPAPVGIEFSQYGEPYRGQPSVVYSVPITIATTDSTAMTASYAGYGDPDGLDGDIRPPDATIDTTVPGSGASRLALTSDGYRVKATSHVQFDSVAPSGVGDLAAETLGGTTRISFVAPGDDGLTGQVTGYDIRISPGVAIDATNFASMTRVPSPGNPVASGDTQIVDLPNLLPDSDYYIGIEPIDDCHNIGPLQTLAFHTAAGGGTVDACFVATAAYGSVMVRDVSMLRMFRDSVLERSVLGELVVESYYTFGPPVAHVVGESELLRATARGILAPIVERVRALSF